MSPGNMCHRGTNFLTGKYMRPIVSLGIVVGDGIPYERSSANIPRREVAEENTLCKESKHTRLRMARNTIKLKPPMSASMEACIARHAAALTLSLPVPTDIPEADMPPQKRACLTTLAPGFEAGESSAAGAARQPGPALESDRRRYRVEQTGYGITDTWDEIVDTLMEKAPNTLEGVDQRVIELDTTVRHRTEEFEVRFEEAQDDRAFLRARVNTLFRDKPFYHHTVLLLDREATYAHREWASSEDMSAAIEAYVRRIEAHVATLIAQTSSLQTQLTTTLEQRDADMSRDGDNSHGTEGVVGLTQWVEKMESIFLIGNCTIASQVKYASCTLKGSVLTLWNSHVRVVGQDVAYAMP
nr:reverse transcriptase domain-containing protein [Tanacetum cinerariifolium]